MDRDWEFSRYLSHLLRSVVEAEADGALVSLEALGGRLEERARALRLEQIAAPAARVRVASRRADRRELRLAIDELARAAGDIAI